MCYFFGQPELSARNSPSTAPALLEISVRRSRFESTRSHEALSEHWLRMFVLIESKTVNGTLWRSFGNLRVHRRHPRGAACRQSLFEWFSQLALN